VCLVAKNAIHTKRLESRLRAERVEESAKKNSCEFGGNKAMRSVTPSDYPWLDLARMYQEVSVQC
jgi:hypothetical protein